jgi:chaperonin GroES
MASKAFRSFVPFFDRVLIQKSEAVTKTASGLIIPEKAQAKINSGVVVAHGEGREEMAMNVKVGDKVLLPEFGGAKIKLGDDEFQLFRNSELIGKFEE